MSTNEKVKIYKNSARNKTENYKPYVPQYQIRGVEPEEYKSPVAPGYQIAVQKTPNSADSNTRGPRPVIRQPYAEAVPSPVGRGRGPLPNVGNNMEQTWSSVDGDIVDDISGVDTSHAMVDNNDFVSEEALGISKAPEQLFLEENVSTDETGAPSKGFFTENELKGALSVDELSNIIRQLDEDEYLLLINGETICSGPLDYIQEQTTLLVFGEHELFHGNPVSVDDIIVIKRVKVKVGVFLV